MKWIHREVVKMTGGSLSPSVREFANAVNINADVLQEAAQKIEELNKEIERLKADKENC